MHRFTRRLALAAAVLAFAPACQTDDPTAPPDADPGKLTAGAAASPLQTDRTPFQLALMESIARRTAQGLSVPSDVSFEYESQTAAPLGVLQQRGMQFGEDLEIVATTVLHFDNPVQAGLTEWPAVVVADTREN